MEKTENNFVDCLIKKLENIKRNFEDKAKEKDNSENDALQLKVNVLKGELKSAFKTFDVAKANKIQKELTKLQLKVEENLTKNLVLNEHQKQELRREMTYQAFFELKNLPAKQVSLILNTSKELKNLLGDWHSTLSLWLNC